MARAARSNYESSSEEFDTKRLATLIGGGVAVAVVVLFLGFKMFGSKSEAPKPAAPPVVAHAPEYPPEVTQLVAQTEAAFKADDFKAARADVDRLRQLSPSHPRLDFFQGLLLGRAEGGKGAASGRGAAASSTKKTKGGGTSTAAAKSDTSEPAVAKDDTGASATAANPGSVSAAAPSTTTSSSADSPGMMPETPVGLSRDSAGAASAGTGAAAATGAMAAAGTSAATTAPGAAGGTSIAPSASEGAPAASAAPAAAQGPHTPAASTTRRAAGEPPPVVQEAKLIRRVNPDYPSAAKKDGIAGSVDLEVTVSAQGVVENVSVIQATPPDMFDKSAVAAVRKWKYDPRFVDGLPSQAHLKVHLEFGPNK
jgi:TonB family protein